MADIEVVVKDFNDAGGAAFEDGEPTILGAYLNYLPHIHDLMKIEEQYYEVMRVIHNFDSCNAPVTIVVRKYVINPVINV